MPSRSCGTGRAVGFTLIELMVVLGIFAMAAGLVAAGLGSSSARARERRALEGLATELLVARIDAMRTGTARDLTARIADASLSTHRAGRERQWKAGTLVGRAPNQHFAVRFDPCGRTTERRWEFAREGQSANTLFVIEFDPVSGAPNLRRASERSPFTEDRP